MKAIRPLILVLVIACFALPAHATKGVSLANGEWRPYQSKELKHYGVASHIVTEAFKNAGYTVNYTWYDTFWKRAYTDVNNSKLNGSLLWSKKPARLKEMYFSDVVISGKKDVLFFLKGTGFSYKTLDDLKGKTIGGTIGYNYGKAFETAEKNGTITVVRVKDDVTNFKILLKKRIDAFVCGLESGKALLKQNFSKKEIQNIRFYKKPVRVSTYHLILSKKNSRNKTIIADFNRGLNQLKESGKYNQYLEDSKDGKYEVSDDMGVGETAQTTNKAVAKNTIAKNTIAKNTIAKKTIAKKPVNRRIPLLLKGSNNQHVKTLQKKLKALNYYKADINGFFDIEVHKSVIKFQRDNDLTPDGIIGPNTRRVMGW